ncbi:hypothetical protein [Pseudolysinimonas sp.]|uniref:hypothetical protein n=1 Tax=Pseudolysinimonas sp. TaxID=2680009 RepID=UPI003782ED4B
MNLPTTVALKVATPGVRVTPLASGKWRVTSRSGGLLGHLEALDSGEFRAMRFSIRERGYRVLGEFRTATDAADALRFG